MLYLLEIKVGSHGFTMGQFAPYRAHLLEIPTRQFIADFISLVKKEKKDKIHARYDEIEPDTYLSAINPSA